MRHRWAHDSVCSNVGVGKYAGGEGTNEGESGDMNKSAGPVDEIAMKVSQRKKRDERGRRTSRISLPARRLQNFLRVLGRKKRRYEQSTQISKYISTYTVSG